MTPLVLVNRSAVDSGPTGGASHCQSYGLGSPGVVARKRGRRGGAGHRPSLAREASLRLSSLSVESVAAVAVSAAGCLASACTGRDLCLGVQSDLFPPAVAAASCARMSISIREAWPPPANLTPCAALRDLLKSDDLYHLERKDALAPYDPDKLQLVRTPMEPKEISTVVSPEAGKFIMEPDRWIVEADDELLRLANHGVPLRPYWDTVLRRSKGKKHLFNKQLHRAGLLTWRRRSRAAVGCFFVKKKSGMLRLVVDGRIPNSLHRRAPKARLAVASALGRLDFSTEGLDFQDAWNEMGAAEHHHMDGVEEEDDEGISGYGADLIDGFY